MIDNPSTPSQPRGSSPATDEGCYLGMMSGTSVDAVDAVVARFDAVSDQPQILGVATLPPDAALRNRLLAMSRGKPLGPEEYGQLDQAVGEWFAEAAIAAMHQARLSACDIAAIGSHGQTIWHAPEARPAFSLQIGSAARIAARTGCSVVADFRNADMAVGGQGAPLVCAFHAALFAHPSDHRIAANIGGIANLTILPAGCRTELTKIRGFDTGPGNGLMDAWIQRERGENYDTAGSWAASGTVDCDLLERLAADPYFAHQPPKSSGREHFSLAWLDAHLAASRHTPTTANVQATLCELTARTIVTHVDRFGPGNESIYLCGGGVYNRHLLERISALAAPRQVHTTQSLGIEPGWIEALAFAWLARQRLLGRPGNAPSVTGARQAAVLGGWHLPPPSAQST